MSGIQNSQEHVRNSRNRNRGRGRQSNNHPGAMSVYSTGNNAGNIGSLVPTANRPGHGNPGPNYNGAPGMQTYSNDAHVHGGYSMVGNIMHSSGNVPATLNYAGGYGTRAHGSNMPVNSGHSTVPTNMNTSGHAYGGTNSNTMGNAGYNMAANAAVSGAAGTGRSSPAITNLQRRQSLRDESVRDVGSARAQYGPVGGPLSAPFRASPVSMATAASNAAARAIIAAGRTTISITAERERPGAKVASPAFLHGYVVSPSNYKLWNDVVLPHLTLYTFEVSSTSDLHFFANMLSCRQLPLMFQAITHVAFPGFYWFSGVAHNRRENPYFVLTRAVPGLQTISLRFHTAGITMSAFSEYEMLEIEQTDQVRARERKLMSLDNVVDKYDLRGIFACPQLRRICVEFIDCSHTRYFTKVGDAVDLLREIQVFFVNGCAQAGLSVLVELVQVQVQ